MTKLIDTEICHISEVMFYVFLSLKGLLPLTMASPS